MFGHSALKPKEVGLVRLMPVVVLSDFGELKKQAEEFLRAEFDDYLNIIELESLEGYEGLESLKEYKLHIIHIEAENVILAYRSGEKTTYDYNDLEELLEKLGRDLIYHYHRTNKL